jgi:hypothetical protein
MAAQYLQTARLSINCTVLSNGNNSGKSNYQSIRSALDAKASEELRQLTTLTTSSRTE